MSSAASVLHLHHSKSAASKLGDGHYSTSLEHGQLAGMIVVRGLLLAGREACELLDVRYADTSVLPFKPAGTHSHVHETSHRVG